MEFTNKLIDWLIYRILYHSSVTNLNLFVRFEVFTDYEEWRLLSYKKPVRTSQETHYASATETSWLMLCKSWGFHGGDYLGCHLLGYKNPVRTSQETHYVSATELSRWMLCKIWGFHGGDYEECRLLGSYSAWLLQEPTSSEEIISHHCQGDKNRRTGNNVSRNLPIAPYFSS
jgi:hypothetical protein